MLLTSSNVSCGVSNLMALGTHPPEILVHRILKERLGGIDKTMREAFIIFSDIAGSNGDNLAEYIKKHPKFGKIVESSSGVNPNTMNTIKVWIWEMPWTSGERFERYAPAKGWKRVGIPGLPCVIPPHGAHGLHRFDNHIREESAGDYVNNGYIVRD